MKDILKKYSIKMMKLGIRNRLFFHPAKLNNILDNLNKISVKDILNDDHLGVYYIKYSINIFYLVIDDVKGYFKKVDDNNYLNIIFDNEKYEKIFKSIWDSVIKFKSDFILKYGCMININTVTIIIKSVFKDDSSYYPQIYLDNCSYNYKNE